MPIAQKNDRRGANLSMSMPASRPARRRAASSGAIEELRKVAGTPAATSASTWSFMSAMSGETTSVRPERMSAGS